MKITETNKQKHKKNPQKIPTPSKKNQPKKGQTKPHCIKKIHQN